MKLSELTIAEYTNLLEKKVPFPGGGSAFGLVLELACSLALMSANFTVDKKGYESVQDEIKSIIDGLKVIKIKAHSVIDEDGEAYNAIVEAYRSKDKKKIEEASYLGCKVPYDLYINTKKCEEYANRLEVIANKNLIADVKASQNLCRSIYLGCIDNIKCNIDNVEEEKKELFMSLIK